MSPASHVYPIKKSALAIPTWTCYRCKKTAAYTYFVLLPAMLLGLSLAHANDASAAQSITDYFKHIPRIVSRNSFYNTGKIQRVEYFCENDALRGGPNEGANNPSFTHCAAALFVWMNERWTFSDRIELRYGAVKKFNRHNLTVEMLEYETEDALCCPSDNWTRVFNTESGKLVEDLAWKEKALIVQAVKDGLEQKRIADLIDRGYDVNAQDEHGQTALMIAAEKSNVELTKLLLEHHARVNTKRNNGKTALAIAAGKGSFEIVNLLLHGRANPNIVNNEGRSALDYAIQSGNRDIPRLLVESGADVNAQTHRGKSVLMQAVVSGREDIVRLLLKKGADANNGYEGISVLEAAAVGGKCKIAQILLDGGASANERTFGHTVLMRAAAYSRDTDCLQALLDKGADINAKDLAGQTPLHYAATYGPVANVAWLLKNGADPTAIAYGRTPLEAARNIGNKKVVEFLENRIPR